MAGAAFRRLKAAIFKPSEPAFGSTVELREEYSVVRSVEHGFPHRPSAISFSPELRVLALGCQSGEIFVFGKSGVEVTARHDPDSSVQQIVFLGRQMAMVTVGSENDIHLWWFENVEDRCRLKEKRFYQVVYPGSKRVSVVCYPAGSQYLAVGTEGGNILLIGAEDLVFSNKMEDIIFWNRATEIMQGTNKLHPGSVEALSACPADLDKLLIGYEKGTLVLWSISQRSAIRHFPAIQYLCTASWHPDGRMFASAHEDGSIAMWNSEDEDDHGGSIKPYGVREECRKIQHLGWKGKERDGLLVFEGGLGRQEFADRFCISVLQGKDLVAFEFTSRIIAFTFVDDGVTDEPDTLIVLCEEELVAIDLKTPGMPSIPKPYLYSLHDSPLTCIQHVTNVPHDFWQALRDAHVRTAEKSTRPWPVDGGILKSVGSKAQEEDSDHSILVTGHEDGSIRFWDATDVSMSLMYKVTTNNLFLNVDVPPEEEEEERPEAEKWPVFVKTGTFDPFCDDPRLAIMQIDMCPLSRTMAVGGYGGQVFIFDFSPEAMLSQFSKLTIEMKLDGEDISRKLNEVLEFQTGSLEAAAGFQASVGLLTCPPSPILALSLSTQFGLVGMGCRRGMSIVDYFQTRELATECTILEEESRQTLSRLQSIRKSFRLTMRQIRSRSIHVMGQGRRRRQDYDTPMAKSTSAMVAAPPPGRQREKRETEEEIQQRRNQLGNGIRCVHFAKTFGPGISTLSATGFGCTNSGRTFLYSLELPADVNRHQEPVTVRPIEREFSLRHGAPILAFTVVDHSGRHIASSFEINMKRAKRADNRTPHYAVFCTEEQVKVVTLPALKGHAKFKLYDSDGSQLQRIGFIETEDGAQLVAIVSNDGEAIVLSLPDLQVRMRSTAVRWDDFRGQRTFVFTRRGEAFHMRSPSQLQRLALGPTRKVSPKCHMAVRAERPRRRGTSPTSSGAAASSEDIGSPTESGMERKRFGSALSSALGSIFQRNRTPTPTGTDSRDVSSQVLGKPTPPATAPRSKPSVKTPPPATSPPAGPTNEADFFADQAAHAEEEGDFISDVLSGMDSFHTAPESSSTTPTQEHAKPVAKPRTPSKSSGSGLTAHERMVKAAEERGERLAATDVRTKKMADSAAGLLAISGLMASKGEEKNSPAGGDAAITDNSTNNSHVNRAHSIPNDPKSHEDMENVLDLPSPKSREVNIDEATSKSVHGNRSRVNNASKDSGSPKSKPVAAARGSKKWWKLK